MKNIFIIGSKGVPANYGGFESFVDNLVTQNKNKNINYHISCMSNNNNEFQYNGARCFNVNVPQIGSARAVIYDIIALKLCISYIEKNSIDNAEIYILACRIGPFYKFFKKSLKKNNIYVHLNPDGHEWKRSKWPYLVKKYWKLSESLMIKHCDNIICDSQAIEKYINSEYKHYKPKTMYISYGSKIVENNFHEEDLKKCNEWFIEKGIKENEYFLIVGRFVSENNYETMIREFVKSNSKKDLVIITNVKKDKFYRYLEKSTGFPKDKRVKFVGTVYDTKLLNLIRNKAFAYIHGHEVGGTNPSLLESLGVTNLNILLDVHFNKEVGQNSSLYFTKDNDSLKNVIEEAEKMSVEDINEYGVVAKGIIENKYNWSNIVEQYEEEFLRKKEI